MRPPAPECRCPAGVARSAGRSPRQPTPAPPAAASVCFATSTTASAYAVSPSNSVTRSTARAVTPTPGSSAIARRHAANRPRVSAPVPQTSSGLVGARPSSRRSPMVATVAVRQGGELDAQFVGEVGGQRAFGAGVVHRGDPAASPSMRTPSGREQLERVGQFGHVADAHGARRRAERLPGGALTGQRARMRRDHRPTARRSADGQDDHRHAPLGRTQQRPTQSGDRPRRLQQQRDDRGARVVERVVDVVGGVGHQFLARGHREPEAETAVGPQQRGERRSRMGHQAITDPCGNGSGSR